MNSSQEQRYNYLYEQNLINLSLQGKRSSTIDTYARSVRRITEYFDQAPDTLTTTNLKQTPGLSNTRIRCRLCDAYSYLLNGYFNLTT